jgi:arsenate reductase/regulatory protein spx
MVGLSEIFAWRSPSIKQMGLAGQDISEDEMVNLMLQEPRLVRRPLIRVGDRLLVGGNIKAIEATLAGE